MSNYLLLPVPPFADLDFLIRKVAKNPVRKARPVSKMLTNEKVLSLLAAGIYIQG